MTRSLPNPPRRIVHWSNRGFTLIEIVIVVLIIGIALALAIPSLFISEDERVRQESERLIAVLEQTRDHSVFSNQAVAVRLTEEGIEFLERDPDSVTVTWKKADHGGVTSSLWRDGIRAAFTHGERNREATDSVVFFPAGVSAPFEMLVFSERNQALKRIIVGDALGNVSIKR